MACVFVRLRPVALDQQPVIPIRLDVEVALTRKADYLHRKVVGDAVVEDHVATGQAYLRALVADDRPVESEPSHPRQGAGKRPPGAGDHLDAGRDDSRQRVDVARVEV
jgi:hypothetical protein